MEAEERPRQKCCTRGVRLAWHFACLLLGVNGLNGSLLAGQHVPVGPSKGTAKTQTQDQKTSGSGRVPQLVDITASTGIRFEHLASPEQKYIVESMSGGVALLDYDGDGWLDIYFTNAPNVAMALAGKKARSFYTLP